MQKLLGMITRGVSFFSFLFYFLEFILWVDICHFFFITYDVLRDDNQLLQNRQCIVLYYIQYLGEVDCLIPAYNVWQHPYQNNSLWSRIEPIIHICYCV